MQKTVHIAVLLLSINYSIAQHLITNKNIQTATAVIEAYNNHDYKKIRSQWATWTKLFVTEKKLKSEFEKYHATYGLFTIDTILAKSRYECIAKIKPSKKQHTNFYFAFIFNDNAKLEGMGESYPELIYRKKSNTPANSIAFKNEVDTLLIQKNYISNHRSSFNGCIAVVDNEHIIYKKCVGYANEDSKQILNDTTLFELASVSKQFTAFSILILEQRGLLKLTDTLQKYFPKLPYSNITIHHLLTHTSGLPDYEVLLEKVWDKNKFATNGDVIQSFVIQQPKPHFKPGEQFEYSNAGYVLLASIIEKVSGQSFHDFLSENIFRPLQMKHSRVYNTRRHKKETLPNYAYGYVYSEKQNKYILPDSVSATHQAIYQDAIVGDGTVNSCINDLIIWENEIANPKLLNNALIEKAFTNYTLLNGTNINYGYGFFLSGGGATERLTYHTGGWHGYHTLLLNIIDQKKQIIILSNNEYAHFSRMADDIAEILLK